MRQEYADLGHERVVAHPVQHTDAWRKTVQYLQRHPTRCQLCAARATMPHVPRPGVAIVVCHDCRAAMNG